MARFGIRTRKFSDQRHLPERASFEHGDIQSAKNRSLGAADLLPEKATAPTLGIHQIRKVLYLETLWWVFYLLSFVVVGDTTCN